MIYRLAPDAASRSADEVIRSLQDRVYTDAEGLFNLWLDYSVADVMHYLSTQCELYNHDLSEQELEEVKSIIRSALETYSVSQLWSVVWKVVRDAASLANREYYNRPKAAATIPGRFGGTWRRCSESRLNSRHGGVRSCIRRAHWEWC